MRSSVVLPSRFVRCSSTICTSVLFWYRKSTPKRDSSQNTSLSPPCSIVLIGLRDATRSRTLRSNSKLEAIRKQPLAQQYICWIVSAYPISRGVRSYVAKRPGAQEISLGSHGRTMGHRGTADPPCQVGSTWRTSTSGRHAGSPQHAFLSEPERVPMGHAAT